MIHTMLCATGQELTWDLEQRDIRRVLDEGSSILWLDLERPTPEEMALLASEF